MLEVVDRGQKITVHRDPLWVPGRMQATITLHDQHYDNAGWVAVSESLVLDGRDGYARVCNQMRHALRYAESGGRLWTPRRNLPKESIVIGAPELLTSLGAKAEAYNLSALSLATKTQSLEWNVSGVKIVNEHNWRKIKTTLIIDKFSPTRFRWPVTLNNLGWRDWDIVAGDTVVARMLPPWAEDATGKPLPVTVTMGQGYVEYSVDTAGAVFPVTVDPTFVDGYGGDVETALDTALNSTNSDKAYGTDTTLTGYIVWLMRFDLSSIAAGSSCDSANLSVYNFGTKTTNRTYEFHELLAANADWTEGATEDPATGGQSTWDYKAQTGTGAGTVWAGSAGASTAGTDYAAATLGTATYTANDPQGTEIVASLDTTAVATWFGASNSNYGIRQSNATTAPDVYSAENATTGRRPKLTVTYTAAGGASAAGVPFGSLALLGVGR